MNTIKPIVAPFMAMILAMFWLAIPAQASGLTLGGYHDDGVGGDGNHYFEVYWYSSDPNVDCSPYSGTDGSIAVQLAGSQELTGRGWVNTFDVFQSYAGVSGFSHHECQVNVYATNGLGQRRLFFSWQLNGVSQPNTNGGPTLTF